MGRNSSSFWATEIHPRLREFVPRCEPRLKSHSNINVPNKHESVCCMSLCKLWRMCAAFIIKCAFKDLASFCERGVFRIKQDFKSHSLLSLYLHHKCIFKVNISILIVSNINLMIYIYITKNVAFIISVSWNWDAAPPGGLSHHCDIVHVTVTESHDWPKVIFDGQNKVAKRRVNTGGNGLR